MNRKKKKRKKLTPREYSFLCNKYFDSDNYQIQPGSDILLLKNNSVSFMFKI